jgi:hypothetical protein
MTCRAVKNFKDHTDLLQRMIGLIGSVADQSNLSLAPKMSTYALVDFSTSKAPDGLPRMGDLRNYVATHVQAGKPFSPVVLARVMMLENAVDTSFDPIPSGLQRSLDVDPPIAATLAGKLNAAVTAEAELKKLIEEQVVGSNPAAVKPTR